MLIFNLYYYNIQGMKHIEKQNKKEQDVFWLKLVK